MLNLRQYICRHKFKVIAVHKDTQSNLWQCPKCKAYCILHYGIGVSYICKMPNIGGWINFDEKR